MKKRFRGTFTIEASIIVPLFLWVFAICMQLLFFSHDQVLIGTLAYETVVHGSGREQLENEDLEIYFQNLVEGRTLVMHNISAEVEQSDHLVKIFCYAEKRGMKIELTREMKRTQPEDMIRTLRKLEKIKDQIGEIK